MGNNSNNDESSTSTGGGTSRKNKKSNNNVVPKQPQRGLGVAQLEKIRLHGQTGSSNHLLPPPPFLNHPYNNLSQSQSQADMRIQTPYSSRPPSYSGVQSSSSYGNPNINVMGMSDIQRPNIAYTNSQHGPNRWSATASNAIFDTQQHPDQSDMTRQLFNLHVEESSIQRSKDESEEEEVDLELRLSFKSH